MFGEIDEFQVEGAKKYVRVYRDGDRGGDFSYSKYRFTLGVPDAEVGTSVYLKFQQGLPSENGPNGVTNESVIGVVIDRLQAFQEGDFPCKENEQAINRLKEALFWLQARTRDRLKRNVEGTKKK